MWKSKEQQKEWQRQYYQKKKNDKIYMEKKKLSARKYYQNNKEKCLANRKRYFENNREVYNKYRREWNHNNPSGIYSVIKNGVDRKKNNRGKLMKISRKDFIDWYNKQEKKCFYCKRTLEEIKLEGDRLNKKVNRLTVDRANNKKGYEKENMVLACMRCNAIKSDYFTKEEMLKIGKIVYNKNIRKLKK